MPWKSRPPALLTTSIGDRALGVLGAEVRLQHLELADHVGIRVHRRRAVAARVRGVRAVDDDVERVDAGAVAGEVADRALLAAVAVAVDADDLAAEAGAVVGPVPCVGVMPGSSFRSSAVERPTIGTFWICSEVRRALFSPESTGAISGRDVTDTVSDAADTELDAGHLRRSPRQHHDVGGFPAAEALQLDA